MPGSLIFVVIVAIWAAYLLQHWVRRRETAAATRSVDGFTEAMRVLEKRPILLSADLRAPRPHSYSVMPARNARPTVDVKRAVPAGAAVAGSGPASPLVARRRSTRVPTPAEVDQMTPEQTPRPHSAQAPRRPESQGGRRPGRAVVSPVQRRLRAGLLLVAFAWIPVSIVLAATGALMWLSVPFAVLTLGAVLVWLRTEVQADRARASASSDAFDPAESVDRPSRPSRASRQSRATEPGRTHRFARRARPLTSDDTQVIHDVPQRHRSGSAATAPEGQADSAPVETQAEPAARRADHHGHAGQAAARPARGDAAAYDIEVADRAASPTVQAEVTGPDTGGAEQHEAGQEHRADTWEPVPVPRPTYSMKVKAEPRMTPAGIPADVFDTPEFSEEADELDDRALFARRAAAGS